MSLNALKQTDVMAKYSFPMKNNANFIKNKLKLRKQFSKSLK